MCPFSHKTLWPVTPRAARGGSPASAPNPHALSLGPSARRGAGNIGGAPRPEAMRQEVRTRARARSRRSNVPPARALARGGRDAMRTKSCLSAMETPRGGLHPRGADPREGGGAACAPPYLDTEM